VKPKALILHAAGTNRDFDALCAMEAAGASARIVHVNELKANRKPFQECSILVVPGGFSYADALGAGKLFALDIASFFRNEIAEFVERGKAVIGICNGFQALVKSGILPGEIIPGEGWATLTDNENGLFECRWVTLKPEKSPCVWTQGLQEPISCPVAHGEGRFLTKEPSQMDALRRNNLVALSYAMPDGSPARGSYPENPNGSPFDIAGICNAKGNVLGLMPHPENNIVDWIGPRAGGPSGTGLSIFVNGVRYAKQF
jgi:phosphoribosylformylglycinamidine synthase